MGKYYNKYINHDPVMTLTKFMPRSTWVAHAFEWEKLLKCQLKGKASKKLANGQNIDYSGKKKENGPRASSALALGLNTIIFKHVYWYMQQISGERLQDHWSSGWFSHEVAHLLAQQSWFVPSLLINKLACLDYYKGLWNFYMPWCMALAGYIYQLICLAFIYISFFWND